MARPETALELRRAASSRGGTPATSPRKSATPRKAGKPPVGTPGGTPAAAAAAAGRTTPAVRSRSAFGGAAARSRHGARAAAAGGGGLRSEPTSPRGSASVADSEACMLDELLEGAGSGGGGGGSSDNIRVFVRVRPANAREQGSTAEAPRSCVSISGGRMVVLSDPARPEPFIASFDRVFDPEAGQEEVFSAVGAQMVDNCMAGFNSSIFVYGQTGAGKTHTITGDAERSEEGALAEQCGLTLRVFQQLFDRISQEEHDGVRYTVKCFYAEIYNEEITDLLAPGGSGLQIRDGDAHRGVYVEDLSDHAAVNADDVMRLVQKGSANRHTAATRMNERSSRSHSVFTAVVEAHEEQAASGVTNVRYAKLNLIDLAGSERVGKSGATGDQLLEAKSINKSLTTLARVVTALTERQQHVPYRDSRLTFLLKESLGGNSKTSIIACVSPAEDSAQETHSTLVFAAGAKKIRNRAVVNQDTLGDMKALQVENERLRRELAQREDVLAAGLRQQLMEAREEGAAAEERVSAAEERQQQLEVALNENHASLQQRNAELALVKKEVDDTKATCHLLQKDRESLIDHNAALTERVDQLQGNLERSDEALRRSQQDAAAALDRCEAAAAGQRAAEDAVRSLQHSNDRLSADTARLRAELESTRQSMAAELAQAHSSLEDTERSKRALKREVEQLLSDLRKRQRELADTQELAEQREARLRQEIAELHEAVSTRTGLLHDLESKLAAETVCTAKYRRMVGEIGKLIDWAQSTSPLPPTMGGRTSPAGYPSLMPFGSGRLSFGGSGTPVGEPTSQSRPPLGSANRKVHSASPGKRQLQAGSPVPQSPLLSPSKVR